MDEKLKILIRQCQDNQRDAQAEIYKMFSAKLFSICLRYSNNHDDAKDVFQDGFILIFNKINQFRFEGSFEGWIKRVMVNFCIEKYREKNYLFLINDDLTADQSIEETEFDEIPEEEFSYDELLGFVRNLPTRYQQVFNLYVIDGFSHAQIAESLNITIGTSKSNLSRAREKLMEMIKKNNTIKIVSK